MHIRTLNDNPLHFKNNFCFCLALLCTSKLANYSYIQVTQVKRSGSIRGLKENVKKANKKVSTTKHREQREDPISPLPAWKRK